MEIVLHPTLDFLAGDSLLRHSVVTHLWGKAEVRPMKRRWAAKKAVGGSLVGAVLL
jgi:hypothetical protein